MNASNATTFGLGILLIIGCDPGTSGESDSSTATDTDAATDTDTAAPTGSTTAPGPSDAATTDGGHDNDRPPTDPKPTTGDANGTDTDAEPEEGESSTGEEVEDCVPGETLASDVVMIGDSYLAMTTVPAMLWDNARATGALGADETWRPYHASGTMMADGAIPRQFDFAVMLDPNITTVVMDGGGNDVLVPLFGSASICLSDPPPGAACVAALDNVFMVAGELLDTMAEAGVEDVVYFFYPHLPEPGFPAGEKNATIDYAAPLMAELCESHQGLDCHFVDIRDAFEGHADYIGLDTIHPTPAGSQVIADLVWETMVEHCIAQ